MTIVLALIAVSANGFYAYQRRQSDETVVNRTVDAVARIDEALIAHRLDVGAWPANITALTAYLPNFTPVNGAGYAIAIRAVPPNLVLETYLQNERQRTGVVNAYPAISAALGAALGTCSDETDCGVSLGVGIPGLETSHQALFLQDGSEPFLGNLNMDGNRMENAAAVVFNSSATVGGSCTTRSIATTAGGNLLECFGGTWRPAGRQVARVSGTAGTGSTVSPPAGYSASDCNISVSGAPSDYNYDSHKGWRFFSVYSSPSGSGWQLNAGVYVKTSGNEFSATTSGSVQYQIICVQ